MWINSGLTQKIVGGKSLENDLNRDVLSLMWPPLAQ